MKICFVYCDARYFKYFSLHSQLHYGDCKSSSTYTLYYILTVFVYQNLYYLFQQNLSL